ncbi:MAG: BatA and WFA domain-containing protein, partial [Phycisphaerales bacterium]|nr:BatA and WFA domain-containing protein [Phycisphaerales bacterium]
MTWLTPLVGAIVLASVIPPLLALYFLRLRRTRRPIPSTLLWKRSTEDIRANAPFQRLRANLLLLLQLLVLILLAIALMQPQIDAGRRQGGKTVILIDNSASMNATDTPDDPTRLDEAKRRARERVEELHGGGLFGGMPGEVMVIAFNGSAEVRTPFTDSLPQALAAIDGVEPSDAMSDLGPALELARAYATTIDPEETDRSMVEPATLELYSDGRIQDLSEHVLQASEAMEYHVVGSPESRNVTVISLAADRPYDAPGKVQVFMALQNANPEPVEADVQLSVDGGVRSITPKPVVIPAATVNAQGAWTPGQKQISFTPFEQLRDAVIEVQVLIEDDLAEDDIAALVVPPARRLSVAVVGRHSFEIVELLKSMSLEQLELIDVDTFRTMDAEGTTDQFDVVVLSNVELESLPPGRYLSFGPTPPVDGLEEFGSMGRSGVVSRSMDEHPVLRYVNLDGLYVFEYHKIAPGPVGQPLVESGSGPLVLEIDRGNLQMLHVAFDP